MLKDLEVNRDAFRKDPSKVSALVEKWLLPGFDTQKSARMVLGKVAHMWHGAGDPSESFAGSAFHYLLLALGLIGLALLALRRRWEAIPIALLLLGISAIGGLLLAGNRRNLPVMPLLLALAGVTVAAAVARARAEKT